MKKRISLSLIAAMLFALVAMFAVAPASAADASTGGKAADAGLFAGLYIIQTKRGIHKNVTCLEDSLY